MCPVNTGNDREEKNWRNPQTRRNNSQPSGNSQRQDTVDCHPIVDYRGENCEDETMKTTDYLDTLKARHHLPSDYALAKMLDITRSAVSKYRNNKANFDDTTALKVASLLKLDPMIVISDMNVERSKTPEARAVWQDLHKRLTSTAAALLLAFVVVLGAIPSPVFAATLSRHCILCKITHRRYRSLKLRFSHNPSIVWMKWPFYRLSSPHTL